MLRVDIHALGVKNSLFTTIYTVNCEGFEIPFISVRKFLYFPSLLKFFKNYERVLVFVRSFFSCIYWDYDVICLLFSINMHVSSCLTLWDPMDCSPPGSSVHGILQASIQVGCHFLLKGIFPIQGWNPRPLHFMHWQSGSLPLAPPGKTLLT